MIKAQCGAPAFRVKPVGTVYSDYLIFYEEYDSSLIPAATSAFNPNLSTTEERNSMAIMLGMARFD